MAFDPSRNSGLAALAAFVPKTGRRYAETRNVDHGLADRSNVSLLSPYLRYRLITEAEVVAAVRREHAVAEAFVRTLKRDYARVSHKPDARAVID